MFPLIFFSSDSRQLRSRRSPTCRSRGVGFRGAADGDPPVKGSILACRGQAVPLPKGREASGGCAAGPACVGHLRGNIFS